MQARRWIWLVQILLLGFLGIGKFFAYLGVPAAHIFIGEVALATFLVFRFHEGLGTWFGSLLKTGPLSTFSLAFLAFLVYGIAELLRGMNKGYEPVRAAENLAFNYYPFYIFLGLWVAQMAPDFLSKFVR